MAGLRFTKTPLPVQGRSIGITGRVGGQKDDYGPLMIHLDNLNCISTVNIQSPATSPSKSPEGPGYFKKRKREKEDSQRTDDSIDSVV
jgi:hypothetical protein